jgi:hypothetical protein
MNMIVIAIAGAVLAVGLIFVLIAVFRGHSDPKQTPQEKLETQARNSAENIFDDQFREELRNRGRLHFEKIIGENAMFLQQDLRLTTSQLNEYMKTEITKKLQDEFTKYEQSIMDAKQLAVDSIQKTNAVIEEQRKTLSAQLTTQLEAEKASLIARFEEDMADIINHYVLAAIGNQIDLSDQLEYIMGELETNKQAISEDIKNGA